MIITGDASTEAINWTDVGSITPIRSTFNDQFNASASLGYSYNNASSVARTSLNAEVSHQDTEKLDLVTGRLTTARTDELGLWHIHRFRNQLLD